MTTIGTDGSLMLQNTERLHFPRIVASFFLVFIDLSRRWTQQNAAMNTVNDQRGAIQNLTGRRFGTNHAWNRLFFGHDGKMRGTAA